MASALVLMSTVPCAECDNPAAKFHCDTCGKALCAQCKANHLRSKGTRHHEIVEYENKLSSNYLANLLCHTHETPDPELWCDTCGFPICFSCITEKHKGHEVSKITAVLSQKRDAMREEMKELRDNTVGKWEGVLEQAKQITVDHLQNVDKINKELVARSMEMHKEVDAILLQARQTLQHLTKPGLDRLKEQEKFLNDRVEQLKADVQLYEDELKYADPNALLQYKPGTMQPTETLPSLNKALVPVFTKGQNDTKSMKKMFGQLLSNPSVQSMFDVGHDYPRIACIEQGLAWVETGYNKLQLMDREGSIKDTIRTNFDFYDMTVTSDGDLLLSDYNNSCIKSVSREKGTCTLFRPSMKPTGLSCLNNNDIVVTFKSESKVVVFSRDGQIRRSLDHIKFRFPRRVAVNKVNQDICICDLTGRNYWDPGKLLVIGADDRLRYEYTGQDDKKFYPVEVCTDEMGHILIADYYNHRLHMLDREGCFIQYVLTEQQGLKWPVTIDVNREGYVWVGERFATDQFFIREKGCIKVSRYMNLY